MFRTFCIGSPQTGQSRTSTTSTSAIVALPVNTMERRRPTPSVGEGGRPGWLENQSSQPRGIPSARIGPALSLAEVQPLLELIEHLVVLLVLPAQRLAPVTAL